LRGFGGNHDPSRWGQCLQPGSEVWGRAKSLVGFSSDRCRWPTEEGPNNCAARGNARARSEGRAVRCLAAAYGSHCLERCADSALWIIVVCDRVAEIRQDSVAEEPRDLPAVPQYWATAGLVVLLQCIEEVLGLDPFSKSGGVHEVEKGHCERPPLGD
jgi:hypothetical protein